MDKALKAKLAKAQKMWGKGKTRAETEKGGLTEIEDGRYIARCNGGEITESKSSGRLQVAWKYTILDGEAKGATKYDFDGLESEDNLMYLARKIAKFGYEAPDDLSAVEDVLAAIGKDKPLVKVRLKTKGGSDFQNLYLDSVYSKDDEEEVLADAAAEDGAAEEEATEEEATEEATEDEATEDDAVEEEAPEEEDGGVELTVGMKVLVSMKGETYPGSVLELLEAENKARVKLENGKVVRVATEALGVPDDADETAVEDAEEDVPAKPAKKPAPAPAKKPVGKK